MASLLDLLAPWLSQAQQTPDQVVSAQPRTGANMAVDQSMVTGMPQQSSYDQQLQDPNQWNLGGQAMVPDYSRITTPGNPGGPSYNANYAQTAYPGSTTTANPQASLLPPAARGLLMAADTSASGNPPSLAQMINWLKTLKQQQNPTANEGNGSQQIKKMLQQMQPSNPGAIRQPAEVL